MRSLLLITDLLDAGATVEQSIEPLTRRRRDLRAIGIDIVGRVAAKGAAIGKALRDARADIVVVCPHFAEPPDGLRDALGEARSRSNAPKLVLLDVFDQTSTPLLPLLDVVDRYAKKALLRDRSLYLKPMAGGYAFTDWLVKERGYDIHNWNFGSLAPSEASLEKLRLGWNFTAARRYRRLNLVGKWLAPSWRGRAFDVNARFAGEDPNAGGDWYTDTRRALRVEVERQCGDLKLTPGGRVGLREYVREQRQCRVTVSPFGYGELCLRDIEAIAAGSLLIKPDVSHMRVSPDLFVAGETYLPIRWDGSDVGAVIREALSDEPRSVRIIETARQRFERYSRERGWVEDARSIFEGL